MATLIQDLRFAVRMLFKSPGFTAVAVISLALGIGANTTIFTWMKHILFQPLSGVANSEQFVVLTGRSRAGELRSVSYPDYENWRDENHVFSGVIALDDLPLSLGTSGQTDRVWGMIVSGNYFDVLGVKMEYGRGFLPEEDRTLGTHPVTVLSHKLWQRRFGGAPSIVGQTIQLNGRNFTVVGIAPENFLGTESGLSFDLWVPMMMQGQISPGGDRTKQRGNHWMLAQARLKPGVSIPQAQAEMETIAARLAQEYPNTNDGLQIDVNPLWKDPTGGANLLRPILTILMVVVGLVLLLACANIANLLLARATARQREISVRLAMGAGRLRLVRQLLTESILLACLGGVAGVGVAYLCRNLMIAFVPPTNLPVTLNFELDGTILTFALFVTLLTGIVFGLVPALQVSKPDLVSALKDESGTTSGSRRKARLASALVVAQVALSLLLLIGAGLFLRSVEKGQTIDPGFDPHNMLVASIDLFPSGYTRDRGLEFYRQLLARLHAVPGVEAVTLSRSVPLGFLGRSSTSVTIPGYVPRPNEEINILFNNVGPDYFHTLGIPIVRGRDFTVEDRDGMPDVVVINETMARR